MLENQKIKKLELQIKKLKYLSVSTLFSALTLFVYLIIPKQQNIIRTRGIVIEDENGKDRILIGSPIPYSKDRVRLDSAKVRKWWASEFEGQENNYMEWYKNYKHSTVGMVVLNQEGFDRVLIGDSLADPNIGNRNYKLAGVIWNDEKGWERGGLGVNTDKSGQARSIIGVDDMAGEAVHMVAMEDGTKGLIIRKGDGHIIIGQSKKNKNSLLDNDFMIRKYNTKGSVLLEYNLSNLNDKLK